MGPGYVRFLFIQTIKGKKTTDPPLSQFPGHIREVAPSRSHAPWHETLRMESVLGELKEVWAYHEVHEAWFLALLTSTSPFHSPERGLTLGSRNHVLCTDCVLSKSIRGNPNPQEMVLVHETFGRWLGHESRALMNEISIMRDVIAFPSPFPPCEDTMRSLWPQKGLL